MKWLKLVSANPFSEGKRSKPNLGSSFTESDPETRHCHAEPPDVDPLSCNSSMSNEHDMPALALVGTSLFHPEL